MAKQMPKRYIVYSLSLFLGIAVLFLLYKSTIISIYINWTAENSLYSHGILLLPISVYLFIQEWNAKQNIWMIKFRALPAIILLVLSILWYISETVYIQVGSQILFLFIISFYIYSLLGFSNSLRLSFPILILLSSLPIWFVFSVPLQIPTAVIVDNLLRVTGYTSYQEGFYIHIPEGIFEVGDTCSGLRYQIAAITTMLLYVFYYKIPLKTSIICTFFSSVIAFFSNVVRIYIVILSGHYTNMTHSLLEDHIWLGWIVFGFFFFLYLYLLIKIGIENQSEINNRQTLNVYSNTSVPIKLFRLPIILLLFSSVGPIYIPLLVGNPTHTYTQTISFNTHISGWDQIETTQRWAPTWQKSDFELLASYTNNNRDIDLFISTFINQSQGNELINDLNHPYDPESWHFEKSQVIKILLDQGKTYTVKETVVNKPYQQKRIIWSLYYIDNMSTHSELTAKLLGTLNSITGKQSESVFIISSSLITDIESTRAFLKGFFSDSFIHYKSQLDTLDKNLHE